MKLRKRELIKGGIYTVANQIAFELNERDVEERAGVKRGGLYELFSSKNEFMNDCFFYVLDELYKSNRKILKFDSEEYSIKEKCRCIWFNTLAWWLGNPDMFAFYVRYLTSSYYYDNEVMNAQNRNPYFLLGKEAVESGAVKPMPLEFIHELIVAQKINTLNFIKKNPKLSADCEFLELSFEAVWDSISVKN